jgi:hypothetical protein
VWNDLAGGACCRRQHSAPQGNQGRMTQKGPT